MTTTLPYGSWPSPISAAQLATGGTRLGAPRFVSDGVRDEMWWSESVAEEAGRQAVVRAEGSGGREVLLPAPWNARSRVHEYGGASWTAVHPGAGDVEDHPGHHDPLLLFVEFADQRVHAVVPGHEPVPLSPVGPEVSSAHGPSLRWACPTPVTLADGTREVWWICEDHTGGAEGPRTGADGAPHIERYIAAVPLDGSAAEDPSAIRRVTPASRFVAHPRLSPDGTRLAWITWEHPQMPWDGTALHVAPVVDGVVEGDEIVAGDVATSVLQPEWLDADRLLFLSDASGWWNPWTWSAGDGARRVLEREQEFAAPLWQLGACWTTVLDADHALVVHGQAATSVSLLTVSSGRLEPLQTGLTSIDAVDVAADGRVVLLGASPTAFPALYGTRLVPGADGQARLEPLRLVRSSRDDAPEPGALPRGEEVEVPLPGGGAVHAILYRPRQEGIAGPDGEVPPLIVRVHGGPTSCVPPVLSMPVAYYTSRGLGVVEVNYGGSSGYGRAYRDRLQGQWGVVDVEDTVAVVEHLVATGAADAGRVAVEGGSAGGWTTLACLTRTETFAAGVSSYGVADLELLRTDTHDFESRYLDGLVGPYPERADLYRARAPLHQVDGLSCPVLLLQGAEDRVVPPNQSEAFRDALVTKGIPHAYLLFEGEQHGFRRPGTVLRATESTLSFYGQVLGFRPVGVPVLDLTRP